MELEEFHTLLVIGSAFGPIFALWKGQIKCQKRVPEYMSDRMPQNISHRMPEYIF